MPLDIDHLVPPTPAPEPVPIPPQPVPSFLPIVATTPTSSVPVAAETYDQWFLARMTINRRDGEVYDLETHWDQGNAIKLSDVRTNYIIRNILSQESLYGNPEIAQIAPQFLAALAAAGKRLGVL